MWWLKSVGWARRLNLMGFRRQTLWHLGEIEGKLDVLIAQGGDIVGLLEELLKGVAERETVTERFEQFTTNLTGILASAGHDPAKIAQIKNLVDAQRGKIGAVIAGDPAPTDPD